MPHRTPGSPHHAPNSYLSGKPIRCYRPAGSHRRSGAVLSASQISTRAATMSIEAEQVRSVVESFADSWNRHDMEALAGLFTQDAQFVNVVGLWWRGRDEIWGAHDFTHRTLLLM